MVREDFALLPVYKPAGWTSTDVLNFLKKKFRLRRVGHTGTLDPFAEGVLLLLLGRATRLTEDYQKLPKTYRAEGLLGVDTDTYDITGKEVDKKGIPPLGFDEFKTIVETFKGKRLQTPPPFSAKKINGVRAYKLARRGKKPQLKPVEIEIYRIELLKFEPPLFEIEAEVSGGTYIRSLIRDIGLAAGTVATTKRLIRTAVGGIGIDETVNVEHLKEVDSLEPFLKPPDYGLKHLPVVKLDDRDLQRFANGLALKVEGVKRGTYRVYDNKGNFVALGVVKEGELKPQKVFISR
jgi:tRNA pseudouridine55 synthase